MAGTLQALLLRRSEDEAGPRESPGPAAGLPAVPLAAAGLPAVPLASESGLALLPLTNEIVASVMGASGDDRPVPGFYSLTSGVAEWARQRSRQDTVAYLHTEFFGGGGFHAAVAWRGGAIAWGPTFTATSPDEAEGHYVPVTDLGDMAINQLLRWLGVRPGDERDEFATVGLDRHRWTEQWAIPASP